MTPTPLADQAGDRAQRALHKSRCEGVFLSPIAIEAVIGKTELGIFMQSNRVSGAADSTEASTSPVTSWKTPFAKAPNTSRYAQIRRRQDRVWLTTCGLGALGKFSVPAASK